MVTGIGFLGGGAILREGAIVRELTTAAIGLVLGLAVPWLVKHFEKAASP